MLSLTHIAVAGSSNSLGMRQITTSDMAAPTRCHVVTRRLAADQPVAAATA
jgi:hypothetical protein